MITLVWQILVLTSVPLLFWQIIIPWAIGRPLMPLLRDPLISQRKRLLERKEEAEKKVELARLEQEVLQLESQESNLTEKSTRSLTDNEIRNWGND